MINPLKILLFRFSGGRLDGKPLRIQRNFARNLAAPALDKLFLAGADGFLAGLPSLVKDVGDQPRNSPVDQVADGGGRIHHDDGLGISDDIKGLIHRMALAPELEEERRASGKI